MREAPSLQPYLRRLFDGRTHQLKDGNSIIGRSEDCDLVLDEPGLSRKHARITVDDGQIILFDLGSLNGTLVNGSEAVGKLPLRHGDVIVFDEIEYELLIPVKTANNRESTAQNETVVANRHERKHEELIQPEVRVVDEAFLARETTGKGVTENTVIASINQPTFIIRGVGAAGIRVPLDMRRSEWTIGSSITHDVTISHSSVANRHATLTIGAGQWTLSNSGAGDGLQVNGKTTRHAVISSGDVIRIGEIDCLFVCPREYSDTQNSQVRPGKDRHLPIQTETFDTADMAPVGWRNTREPSPKRRSRALTLIASLLSAAAIAAAYFYWRNIS